MIRNAFNGGEVSPNIAQRPDLDVHARACTRVENFDLSQTGGVRRRRGMRGLAEALPGSRIYPYIYSATVSYLVELAPGGCRILSPAGEVIYTWEDSPWNNAEVASLRVRQVNKYLFVTCSTQPVTTIWTDDGIAWTRDPWQFKSPPLRHSGIRDTSITLTRNGDTYQVVFSESETDKDAAEGEMLSVEITVPTATAYASVNEWRSGSKGLYNFTTMTNGSNAKVGQIVWVREGGYDVWWECVRDFAGNVDFVAGKTTPADYPQHFAKGAPYGKILTCKGEWKFQCSQTWYGEMAVERRYPNETEWTCIATSFSQLGAASNLQPTGEEKGEECYLRLRVYQQDARGPMSDGCSLQLVVSQYKKKMLLRAAHQADGTGVFVTDFRRPANDNDKRFLLENTVYDLHNANTLSTKGGTVTVLELGGGTLRYADNMLQLSLNEKLELRRLPEGTDRIECVFDAVANWHHLYRDGSYYFLVPKSPNATITTRTGSNSSSQPNEWRAKVDYYEYTQIYPADTDGPTWHHVGTDCAEGKGALVESSHALSIKYSNMFRVDLSTYPPDDLLHQAGAHIDIPAGEVCYSAEFSKQDAVRPNLVYAIADPVPESCPAHAVSRVWSWEAYTRAYGYPTLCDIYQQRLVFASTRAQQQTAWMSKTDDINNFEISDEDDGALSVTLSTTSQNPIVWMLAQNARLLLGTTSSEWTISGGDGGITASNARADNSGFVGSAAVPATMAVDKCVYVERGGGRAYQYGYNYEADAYMSADLTVFADHILCDGGGVVSGCFLRKPDPRAVFALNNGTLALMTYNTMHNVNAWHRYTTDGRIEDAVALPNGNKDDLLFLLVDRTNSTKSKNKKRMIEVIAPENDYVDNGELDYTSTLVTVPCGPAEAQGTKRQSVLVGLCLGEPTPAGGIEISNNGQDWRPIDRDPAATLPKGWQEYPAPVAWRRENSVGIRVKGNRGFSLFCVQSQEE